MVEIKRNIPKYVLHVARVVDRLGRAAQKSLSANAQSARDSAALFAGSQAEVKVARCRILQSNQRFALAALVYDVGREHGYKPLEIRKMVKNFKKLSLRLENEMLKTVPSAMEAGLTPLSITYLCERVIRLNLGYAENILGEFPKVFAAAKRVGLTPEETTSLISKTVGQIGSVVTDDALYALPAMLDAGYRQQEVLGLYTELRKNIRTFAEKAFRSLPALLESGLDGSQAVAWLSSCEANRGKLLPIEYCIASLNSLHLLRSGEDIETVKADNSRLLSGLKDEGERAHKSGQPTVGGKIGGSLRDLDQILLELLRFLGIETRKEILGTVYPNHTLFLLPPARSAAEAIRLIDLLKAVGLFKNGHDYRHQVTLSGKVQEDAKYIALALHSAQSIRPDYPPEVPVIGGYENVAPVAEGGGVLVDLRGTKSRDKDRFDIPMLCLLQISDLRDVFINAQKKKAKDRTAIEGNLLAFYEQIKERCHNELELDLDNDPYGFLGAQVFNAFEASIENFINVWDNNHHLTIEAAALLTWGMQAEPNTPQARIFLSFKLAMQRIFKQRSLDIVLNSPWINRKWVAIYPELYRFEQAERHDLSFADEVRGLVCYTIDQLKSLQ
jgi:hypothetical protein